MKRRKSCWKRLQALALTLLLAVGAAIPVCAAEKGDNVTVEARKTSEVYRPLEQPGKYGRVYHYLRVRHQRVFSGSG